MDKLARIYSYGEYANNYGTHALAMEIGGLTIFFSYETPIAFRIGGELVIRENDWGGTTGKHLNWINREKKIRISAGEFEGKLEEQITKYV